MSPGIGLLLVAARSILGLNVKIRTYVHVWIKVYVCARVSVCALCKTVTSCSPELKVHSQQNP